MVSYFGIRSGNLIKLDQVTKLVPQLFNSYRVRYFQDYKTAYHYVFGPSFATTKEKHALQRGDLDWVVYTDGGQRNGNDGAWAYSINDVRRQLVFKNHYFNTKNNNYCELAAVIAALKKLVQLQKNDQKIQIDTDSVGVKSIVRNVRHGISIQSIAWHTEWKMAQLRQLKQILRRFSRLRIKRIEGHAGILGNQLVHQLCSQAMGVRYRRGYDPFRINKLDYHKHDKD